MTPAPILFSIAGTDSGGGAGLAADLRAADAVGVHLCPVVAAVTAQNSVKVARVAPLAPELIDAQLDALAADMPPRAVKTGLLGGVAQVRCVAHWIDRLRAELGAVALVVDPVFAASSGASFADTDTLSAYRDLLLPRATLVTPNRREAIALAGRADDAPALARALRAAGARAVCVTGGDEQGMLACDWIDTEHAQGWLALRRIETRNTHGTGCTFAASAAAALALGFVAADALVLAKMATAHALQRGHAAGAGPGPVIAGAGFGVDAAVLPQLSFDMQPRFVAPRAPAAERLDLYAIVDSAERVRAALAAGVRSVQLRIKAPREEAALRAAIADAVAACRAAGARLFVNDHWRLAIELDAYGVHLGQQDLLQLSAEDRAALLTSGLALGVSSHSLWELARAKSLAPSYIACGPVWPTTTKEMPWRPQGLDNLAWWCAVAGAPVVAIGGILTPEQVRAAASCGADGVCLVRGLGDDCASTVPQLMRALLGGRRDPPVAVPGLPHPSLGADG